MREAKYEKKNPPTYRNKIKLTLFFFFNIYIFTKRIKLREIALDPQEQPNNKTDHFMIK